MKDKFFDHCLEKYKEHWHRYGKHDCKPPQYFLDDEKMSLTDYHWIHILGEDKWKEFESYIESGELAYYIHNQMNDYAGDLKEERILHRSRFAGNLRPV